MADRLSAQDAMFLYVESPTAHMHVGSLAVFDELQLSEEQVNAHIESRLHLVPRFRKKLAWVPGDLNRPVWVDDPDFDIRFHIRYTGLPKPRGWEQAKQLMGRLMSRPLDRARPLWEMWIFDLPDGRTAMIQKTHHCLIDGISGVDVGTVMLDLSAEPTHLAVPPYDPQPTPTRWQLARDALSDVVRQPREHIARLKEVLQGEGEVQRRADDIAKGVVAWGKASMEIAPTTSLSAPIGAYRRFETVRAKLDDVKQIKNRHSCTVNDVMLGAVAGGLGKVLRRRGEDTDGLELKAMVPVSVRDKSQRMTYGNKVSMMNASLPVGEPNARLRLERIRERMAGLKRSKQAVGADFWVKMSEYAPPTVLSLASRAIVLQRTVNLVVTNVPGPQFPLFLQGAQLREAFPCVPILGRSSIAVGILSYNGQISFGLNGDWDVVPDLKVLADGIEESLDAMR